MILNLILKGMLWDQMSLLTVLQFKLLSTFLCGEVQIYLFLCCHPSHLLWDVQLLYKMTQSSGTLLHRTHSFNPCANMWHFSIIKKDSNSSINCRHTQGSIMVFSFTETR